ncbi:MAG: tetratricopeptide repeat protein [Verrucomicrobiota bacterium]|nr:tetratricopeptide repeat protein [Verrucomicrobiota bacterium]
MPEKSLQEIPRAARDQYEKGVTAFQRQNLDYAMTILNQVLEKEPAFYDCRQALRATQFKKAGGKSGFFKKMLGSATNSPMLAKGQLSLRSNPLEAIQIAEQILNGDPHNSSAHKLLADAALAADFPKTAILSLEILVKNAPKDHELALELAQAYTQANQIDKAEALYIEFLRAQPHRTEVAQALKNLAARKTMSEGGYDALADGSGSYRDILKNKEEAVSLEQEKREVKSDDVAAGLIAQYESRLQSEPNNLKLMRSVAELYAQKKEFDRALDYYNQIAAAGSSDPALEKTITDLSIKKLEHVMAQLDPASPDFAEQSAQLEIARDNFSLNEVKRRVEKYPNDLQLRFDLGQLYFKAGKISEAIQELQKAQNNPHRRLAAMGLLGQCFAKRGRNDLAARTLQNAIKEKVVFDEEKKELIYELGCVLEKMGKPDEAIEQFKQIYEVDIGYRDVAAKVDAYYAGN